VGEKVPGGAVVVTGQGPFRLVGVGLPGDRAQSRGWVPVQPESAAHTVGNHFGIPGLEGVFGKGWVVKDDGVGAPVRRVGLFNGG
jgi:hypothetical protein